MARPWLGWTAVDRPLDIAFLRRRLRRRVLVGGAVLSLTSAAAAGGADHVHDPVLTRGAGVQ